MTWMNRQVFTENCHQMSCLRMKIRNLPTQPCTMYTDIWCPGQPMRDLRNRPEKDHLWSPAHAMQEARSIQQSGPGTTRVYGHIFRWQCHSCAILDWVDWHLQERMSVDLVRTVRQNFYAAGYRSEHFLHCSGIIHPMEAFIRSRGSSGRRRSIFTANLWNCVTACFHTCTICLRSVRKQDFRSCVHWCFIMKRMKIHGI